MITNTVVRVGAVAAGPSVATIWEGMRAYFEDAGVPIVPVLFSSYEEQTEALFARAIDIAWNGPVAYVRCATRSPDCQVLAMRGATAASAAWPTSGGNALPWATAARAGARSSRCITCGRRASMSTAT